MQFGQDCQTQLDLGNFQGNWAQEYCHPPGSGNVIWQQRPAIQYRQAARPRINHVIQQLGGAQKYQQATGTSTNFREQGPGILASVRNTIGHLDQEYCMYYQVIGPRNIIRQQGLGMSTDNRTGPRNINRQLGPVLSTGNRAKEYQQKTGPRNISRQLGPGKPSGNWAPKYHMTTGPKNTIS